MADMQVFKCPACGGIMEFDPAIQKMRCPYCDTIVDMDMFMGEGEKAEAEKETVADEDWGQAGEQAEKAGQDAWSQINVSKWSAEDAAGLQVFSCNNCGGEIIGDDNTAATACPYCGFSVVLSGRVEGSLRPDRIIPFKIGKEEAIKAYKNHMGDKPFLPKVFKDENHMEEIKGIYVPYWIFDANVKVDGVYDASISTSHIHGDRKTTNIRHYELTRKGSIRFEHVPVDASRKLNDDLMDSIEPFHYGESVEFNPGFLAGYLADKFDVEVKECIDRARPRMEHTARSAMRNTASAFSSLRPRRENIEVSKAGYRYVMYPVWVLQTSWRGQHFIFAVNGQTGKAIGDLPIDRKKVFFYKARWTVILANAAYLLAQAIHFFIR